MLRSRTCLKLEVVSSREWTNVIRLIFSARFQLSHMVPLGEMTGLVTLGGIASRLEQFVSMLTCVSRLIKQNCFLETLGVHIMRNRVAMKFGQL